MSYLKLAILLICLLPALLLGCRKQASESDRANYLIKNTLTTGQDSVLIHQVLDSVLDGTKWDNRFQINKTFAPDYINIYLLDGSSSLLRSDALTQGLCGNCYYAGSHIIYLDCHYLEGFLARHKVTTVENNYLDNDRISLYYWIIGHEAGHLVCNHLSGDFEGGALEKFVRTSTMINRHEMQADSFFVHSIIKRPHRLASEEALMLDILNAEIAGKAGQPKTAGAGILYDYSSQAVVKYARQPTHPEYVIRLSRMLELSSKLSADSGLYNLVGSFIKHLKEVHNH